MSVHQRPPVPLDSVLDRKALTPAAQVFVEAVSGRPDLASQLADMALIFLRKKQKSDARLLAQAARKIDPQNFRVRVRTEWLDRWNAPLWHFPMIHDQPRNDAYARALARFVKPGMTVFEIGTGTGLLAMLAIQAGARHVYTCERRPEVADAAREIVRINGFSDRISVIAKDADRIELGVDLPERADLFVAELVENGLIEDDVLALTEMARARFLKPDAILLPGHIAMMGSLVSCPSYRPQYRMDAAYGFDLRPFNRFSPPTLPAEHGGEGALFMSEPAQLLGFDLHQDQPDKGSNSVALTATRTGEVDGTMTWIRLDFGDGIYFENRPPQDSHWQPRIHLLPEIRQVERGEVIGIDVSHTKDEIFVMPKA